MLSHAKLGFAVLLLKRFLSYNYIRDCPHEHLVNEVLPLVGASFSMGRQEGMAVMTCRDTIHLICWYLEGRLSKPVESEIKNHLDGCADCRLVLNAAMNTLDRYFDPPRDAGSDTSSRAA